MTGSEKDKLIIRRDALLDKKRALDVIEKLRQNGRDGQTIFEIDCSYINRSIGVGRYQVFIDLLGSLAEMGAFSFEVTHTSGLSWGEFMLKLTVLDKFGSVYKLVSDEYHDLNNKIQENKQENNTVSMWLYYSNPIWLIWQLGLLAKKHKITSFVFMVLSFLAIDYSMAWRNIKTLLNYIGLF